MSFKTHFAKVHSEFTAVLFCSGKDKVKFCAVWTLLKTATTQLSPFPGERKLKNFFLLKLVYAYKFYEAVIISWKNVYMIA